MRQDLSASLQHYERSKSFLKKVDVSLQLQGRGGVISLDTHEINKERTTAKDVRNTFLLVMSVFVLLPLLFVIGLPILALAGTLLYSSLPFSLILGVSAWCYWKYKHKTPQIANYPTNYLSDLVVNFRQDFDDIVAEKTAKLQFQRAHQHNAWENLFALLWHKVLKNMQTERASMQHPDTALKVYKKYLHNITKLKTKGLEDYFAEIWEITPQSCLEVMKFVMKQKLQQTYLQCMRIINEALALNLDAEIYVQALDLRITLYNFYSGEPDFSAFKRRQDKIDGFREEVSMPPAVDLLGSDSFRAWYTHEQQSLQHSHFEQDFAQLRRQMQTMKNAKKEAKGLATPVFFESSEVIAYIF